MTKRMHTHCHTHTHLHTHFAPTHAHSRIPLSMQESQAHTPFPNVYYDREGEHTSHTHAPPTHELSSTHAHTPLTHAHSRIPLSPCRSRSHARPSRTSTTTRRVHTHKHTHLRHTVPSHTRTLTHTSLSLSLQESQPRTPFPNFYYDQEDALFERAEKRGFTWSVARPHTMIGFAPNNQVRSALTTRWVRLDN